jgi:outer membrane protein TolC
MVTTRTLAILLSAAFAPALVVAQEARLPGPIQTAPGVYRLSLDEAKSRALALNRDLTLARLAVQEKSIATSAAKTDYFPKVLGNVSYLHFNQNLGDVVTVQRGRFGILPPGTTTRAINVLNQDSTLGSFTVAQPITKLILVNAAVKLAGADAVIAQAQLDKGTRDLLSGVAQAFYGLQGAREIEGALAMQAGYLGQAVQADPRPEVRVALIEVQQGLLQARTQAADLNEQLDNLLCYPAGTILMPDDPLPPAIPVHSADDAARMALACNPQVIEARATLDKARAGLQAANEEFLPDLLVFGSYFNQTAAPSIQQNIGAIGVTGSYTFVDWGKRRKVKFQRETQIAQARLNIQATTDKVVLEARRAYLDYEQTQQALALAADMIRARADFETGLKDPAALQAAKAATAKAGLDQLQAEIAYRVASAKLAGAIGEPTRRP